MPQEGSMKTFKHFYEEQTTQPVDNWNRVVFASRELQSALEILQKINSTGNEALIVGGAVRDIILGKEPHDVDIATNMDIEDVAKLFKSFDIGKSQDFGIVAVPYNGYTFEVAHYREESGTSDARHPDEVRDVDSFEQDSARRDITINSLGLDASGTIIDYQGGLEDIKSGMIRAVGNPDERIREDALRIIRVLRFAAKFGFDIEPETKRAVSELGHMLFRDEENPEKTGVSAERLHDELFKMAEAGGPALANFIEHLDDTGLLEKFLPEIKAMQGMEQDPEHHPEGDVYVHTLHVLKASDITDDPIASLATLFHDIGKPETYEFKPTKTRPEGKHTYHRHEAQGVDVFLRVANRLKFSNQEKDSISWVIRNHMKLYKAGEMKPSKIISLKGHPLYETLLAVLRADIRGRPTPEGQSGSGKKTMDDYDEIIGHVDTRTKSLGDAAKIKGKIKSLVDGHTVMKLTGAKGPEVGKILQDVEEWILNVNPEATKDDVIKYIEGMQ
jgi:tRNA nucleotidyltransferase/poly(A) polymerase